MKKSSLSEDAIKAKTIEVLTKLHVEHWRLRTYHVGRQQRVFFNKTGATSKGVIPVGIFNFLKENQYICRTQSASNGSYYGIAEQGLNVLETVLSRSKSEEPSVASTPPNQAIIEAIDSPAPEPLKCVLHRTLDLLIQDLGVNRTKDILMYGLMELQDDLRRQGAIVTNLIEECNGNTLQPVT